MAQRRIAKAELTPAQKQIAKAEREVLERAFITLFCQVANWTRDQFDAAWFHGVGEGSGAPEDRRLATGRKWEWDFVWRYASAPASAEDHAWRYASAAGRVVVEVNGGQGAAGASGHGSWAGLQRDAEKLNAASALGLSQFVFTTGMLRRRDTSHVEAFVRYIVAISGNFGNSWSNPLTSNTTSIRMEP